MNMYYEELGQDTLTKPFSENKEEVVSSDTVVFQRG